MSGLDHIILYLPMFFIFYQWGIKNYNRKRADFWLLSLFPIIYYSVVTGCRTWGPDYDVYYYGVKHLDSVDWEYLFILIDKIYLSLGFDVSFVFVVYGLITMSCVFYYLSKYEDQDSIKYMFAFILPAVMLETCTHIRHGVAFGAALVACSFIDRKRWLYAIIWAVVAINIHKAITIFIIGYFIVSFMRQKMIPIYLSICLYVIATFVPKIIDMSYISNFIALIETGDKYDSYTQRSDMWFSDDANVEKWNQSPFALMISFSFDIAIMVGFYIANIIRKNKEFVTYNLFVIGAILVRFFFLNEILRRLSSYFYILYFIPLGYIVYVYFNASFQKNNKYKPFLKICLIIIALYLSLYYGRFIFLNENCGFVWD